MTLENDEKPTHDIIFVLSHCEGLLQCAMMLTNLSNEISLRPVSPNYL